MCSRRLQRYATYVTELPGQKVCPDKVRTVAVHRLARGVVWWHPRATKSCTTLVGRPDKNLNTFRLFGANLRTSAIEDLHVAPRI